MALPLPANTTCDIYASDNTTLRAAAVPIYLEADYHRSLEHGEGDATGWRYTHMAVMDAGQDVRDSYDAGSNTGVWDNVYVPDRATGARFQVRFVERRGRGTALDHKKVYLIRISVPWPTSNL